MSDKHVTSSQPKTLDYKISNPYHLAAMKTLIPLTALAMLVATSTTYAQTPAYSKPSGYTTQVLKPNRLNYVGLNVLTPSLASGAITAIGTSGLDLTDNKASLLTALPSGKMHTIEITSGTAVGSVREFTSFNNTRVTTSAAITGLKVGDKYIIRKNLTLQELFPNGAPLTGGAVQPLNADVVEIPNGSGGFTSYFYKTSVTNGPIGWWTTPNASTRGVQVTADVPLLYTDGIRIRRRAGVDKNLVITGQVKTTSSRTYVVTGSNPISVNSPVGSTLANSAFGGLQGHATSPATADILLVPISTGAFRRYWRKTSATGGPIGWYLTPDGVAVGTIQTKTVNLPPYCLIERKGAARFIEVKVPTNYSNL